MKSALRHLSLWRRLHVGGDSGIGTGPTGNRRRHPPRRRRSMDSARGALKAIEVQARIREAEGNANTSDAVVAYLRSLPDQRIELCASRCADWPDRPLCSSQAQS